MSILTVCNANICRSPLAEALLRKSISKAGGPTPLIESAGVQAVEGMTICSEAVLALGDTFSSGQAPSEHSSRRLTFAMIDQAHLILVSTVDQRSVVARLSPTARHRSFTFIEAASFLRVLARQADAPGGMRSLIDVTAQMNALRSSTGPIEGVESHHLVHAKRKSSGVVNKIDITDGHVFGRRRHRQTLEQIRHTVTEIADDLEFLGVWQFIVDEGLHTSHP